MCIHCSPKNRVLRHEISSFLILANLSTDKVKADDVSLDNQNASSFHSDNVKLLGWITFHHHLTADSH